MPLQGMIVVPGNPAPAAQELGDAVVGAHAGPHRGDFQSQLVDVPGPHPDNGLHLGGAHCRQDGRCQPGLAAIHGRQAHQVQVESTRAIRLHPVNNLEK